MGAPSSMPSTSGRTPNGIAHADQLLGGQRHQRIGAFHLAQRIDQLVDDAHGAASRRQMDDGFGVGGGLEDRALRHQFGAQRMRVGEIAVMGDGDAAAGQIGENRLDVAGKGTAGGGIAHMADRETALEVARGVGIAPKRVAHQAQMPLGDELAIVVGDDAGRFLAAMLKGVKPQHAKAPASA